MEWFEVAVLSILAWILLAEVQYLIRLCYHGDDLYGRVARLEARDAMHLTRRGVPLEALV